MGATPLIHHHRLIPLHKQPYGAIQPSEGVLFLTYSSLTSGNARRETRLQQIVTWCGGPLFEGTLVFDECHKAKNLYPEKSAKPTKVGLNVLMLQRALPRARVVYCSATGATAPRNMGYMERLGLWGPGTSIPTFEDFLGTRQEKEREQRDPNDPRRMYGQTPERVPSVAGKGVGALELLAMDMKARGMYLCRTLAYQGAEFSTVEVPVAGQYMEMYSRAADLWADIIDVFENGIRAITDFEVRNAIDDGNGGNGGNGNGGNGSAGPSSGGGRGGARRGRGRGRGRGARNRDENPNGMGEDGLGMDPEFDDEEEAVEVAEGRPATTSSGQAWRMIWATHQRFFRALCMSAKVPRLLELAREALGAGHAVVVGLQSTGEARTNDVVAKKGDELGDFVSDESGAGGGCFSDAAMCLLSCDAHVMSLASCGHCSLSCHGSLGTRERPRCPPRTPRASYFHRALLSAGPRELLLNLIDKYFPVFPSPYEEVAEDDEEVEQEGAPAGDRAGRAARARVGQAVRVEAETGSDSEGGAGGRGAGTQGSDFEPEDESESDMTGGGAWGWAERLGPSWRLCCAPC